MSIAYVPTLLFFAIGSIMAWTNFGHWNDGVRVILFGIGVIFLLSTASCFFYWLRQDEIVRRVLRANLQANLQVKNDAPRTQVPPDLVKVIEEYEELLDRFSSMHQHVFERGRQILNHAVNIQRVHDTTVGDRDKWKTDATRYFNRLRTLEQHLKSPFEALPTEPRRVEVDEPISLPDWSKRRRRPQNSPEATASRLEVDHAASLEKALRDGDDHD
jgi:hypothetical protein